MSFRRTSGRPVTVHDEEELLGTVRSDRQRIRRAKDVRMFGVGMFSGSILFGVATGPTEGHIIAALVGIILIGISFVFWRPKHWNGL